MKKIIVYGKQTINEILKTKKREIFNVITDSKIKLENLKKNYDIKCPCKVLGNKQIQKLLNKNTNDHQGYLAEVSYNKSINCTKPETILILDNVNNQGNIGSIIRSSAAFQVDKIILNKRFYSDIQTIFKVASGATEWVDIMPVSNISNEIIKLRKDFIIYSITNNSKNSIDTFKFDFNQKMAFVFGSESEGISNNILKKTDDHIKISIKSIESLNVSNAVSAFFSVYNYCKFNSLNSLK